MEAGKLSPESYRLETHLVEKPWGRTNLSARRDGSGNARIGEIWFEHPARDDLPLLAKYIFTSERLSIQVHPDDAHSPPSGKSECWYIIEAEEGATVGLGLTRSLTRPEIAAAAVDGSIAELLHWRPVAAGDFIYVPARTIHAIGAGIALLEFQQNSDVTYRLYDYGRPRQIHVDEGAAVAVSGYDFERNFRPAGGPSDCVLVDSEEFSLVRATSAGSALPRLTNRRRWVMPLEGIAAAGDISAMSGECLLAEAGANLSISSSALVLVGVEGRL